jgi:hypothetical protein
MTDTTDGGEESSKSDGEPELLDLTSAGVEPLVLPVTEREQRLRIVPDEYVRAVLVLTFTVIFFVTLIVAFVGAYSGSWTQMKDLLHIVLPVETSLLGAAVGYYFGARNGP